MEKEEGDRARSVSVTSDREEILRARKAAEETRTRMEGDDHFRPTIRGEFSSPVPPARFGQLSSDIKNTLFVYKPLVEIHFPQTEVL